MPRSTFPRFRVPTDPEAEQGIIDLAAHGAAREVFEVLHDKGFPYALRVSDFTSRARQRQWEAILKAWSIAGCVPECGCGECITPLDLLDALQALYGAESAYTLLDRFPSVDHHDAPPRLAAETYIARIRDASERNDLADFALEIIECVTDPTRTAAEAQALIRDRAPWRTATEPQVGLDLNV